MKLYNLTENSSTYTSNAYFIRGEWNTLNDCNTLIDAGRDPVLFDEIQKISTGVGKRRIDKVLLSHNHYDHTGNLKKIIEKWQPRVYAFTKSLATVTDIVKDGDIIKVGDTETIVIACPGHSSDSVCFYCPVEKILFSGDTQLTNLREGSYQMEYLQCLEKIAGLDVQTIYPGHGQPIVTNCNRKIKESLRIARSIVIG